MKNKIDSGKLSAWCEKNGTTIYSLSKVAGIERDRLYKIDKNPDSNVTIRLMDEIYKATKKEFGVGLKPQQYLNCSCFR